MNPIPLDLSVLGIPEPPGSIHLVGIGGIGLSAIARVLHSWGYRVSGSDQQPSALTAALAAEGIVVHIGHQAQQVLHSQLVVASSAVPADNVELAEARRRGIPIVKRDRLLGAMSAAKTTIAVAGTHGKTTTSGMIAWLLTEAGLDPTFIVGGLLHNLGTNARAGKSDWFVIEADEYDRTFLGLQPTMAVLTAVEHDHPDTYPTLQDMRVAFQQFMAQVRTGGLCIGCGDDVEARRLATRCSQHLLYGLGNWNWQARDLDGDGFDVWKDRERLGRCELRLPGRHNVQNALAALAVADRLGVPFPAAARALAAFAGTARRFEVKGEASGVTVVDDYAHHPTEIRATLSAARARFPDCRIVAVWQPHTYSRTHALLDAFASSFDLADWVIVTPIYAAREQNSLGISSQDVVARMEHPGASYVGSLQEAAQRGLSALRTQADAPAVLITLGAGDADQIGEWVLAELRQHGAST
jgi:UDP-N-acetylmuramate--alanine ligase